MPSDRRGPGPFPLDVLRASLRLPEVALDALAELRPMRDELVRVRKQTASMPEMLPALARMEQAIAPLDRRLDTLEETIASLSGDIAAMARNLEALRSDVEDLPLVEDDGVDGHDDRGLIEKARDAVTGGDAPAAQRPPGA